MRPPQEDKKETQLHIFLVRHYIPNITRNGWFNYTRATQFIADYDAAGIKNIISKPAGLPFQEVKKVHCSSLPRAKQTALAIFGPEVELLEDKIFNECERKILSLPLFRFPISIWLTSSRLLWLLGLNSRGIETYKGARLRAKKAAEKLAQFATEDKKTVLVAHGMLNAFIRQSLRKTGWRITRKDGNGYLGITELIKEKQ